MMPVNFAGQASSASLLGSRAGQAQQHPVVTAPVETFVARAQELPDPVDGVALEPLMLERPAGARRRILSRRRLRTLTTWNGSATRRRGREVRGEPRPVGVARSMATKETPPGGGEQRVVLLDGVCHRSSATLKEPDLDCTREQVR